MWVIALLLALNFTVLCSPLEDGWKGIKPLSSDMTTVNRILGEPKVDSYGYYRYAVDETHIEVSYAAVPCSEAEYGRGEYSVPAKTVIYYSVHFRKLVKLSELEFAREKYKRVTNEHEPDVVTYYSEEFGITIITNLQGGVEYVASIDFRPSMAGKQRYKYKK
jgi:hypothetical protein